MRPSSWAPHMPESQPPPASHLWSVWDWHALIPFFSIHAKWKHKGVPWQGYVRILWALLKHPLWRSVKCGISSCPCQMNCQCKEKASSPHLAKGLICKVHQNGRVTSISENLPSLHWRMWTKFREIGCFHTTLGQKQIETKEKKRNAKRIQSLFIHWTLKYNDWTVITALKVSKSAQIIFVSLPVADVGGAGDSTQNGWYLSSINFTALLASLTTRKKRARKLPALRETFL